jgi:hypothetical protein
LIVDTDPGMCRGTRGLELICDWQSKPALSAEEQELFRGFEFSVEWNVLLVSPKQATSSCFMSPCCRCPLKTRPVSSRQTGKLAITVKNKAQLSQLSSLSTPVWRFMDHIPSDGPTVDVQPLTTMLFLDSSTEFIVGKSASSLAPSELCANWILTYLAI